MHLGMAAIFQNPENHITDGEVYANELRLAALAEPLGFDSIWGVEHLLAIPDVGDDADFERERSGPRQVKL